MKKQLSTKVLIIGGGLTGLTLAWHLQRRKVDCMILEKSEKAGGVIQTHERDGFIYETGPNTGILAHPEVAELFEMLSPDCELELANPKAENRWILKNGQWEALPSGLMSAVRTPLFSLSDKLRLLGEPFRKRGTEPLETVAGLVKRRLGQSFLDYAVDPFISGIYAGDPDKLVTQFALPKLYALEQDHGSFIRGAVKKARQPKTERDKKATRKVFAAKGGFSKLIKALEKGIPTEKIIFSAHNIKVSKTASGFTTDFSGKNGEQTQVNSSHVVTTVGGHALNGLFDFISPTQLKPITDLPYAKVIQVIVAFNKWQGRELNAFGGLVPTKEKRDILGVLFPSSIFSGRTPQAGALLSIFLGGVKRPELFDFPDDRLLKIANREMEQLLNTGASPMAFCEIYRYENAIPQYDNTSPARLSRINELENSHPGLILAGNIRDGIGIADRIRQATQLANMLAEDEK